VVRPWLDVSSASRTTRASGRLPGRRGVGRRAGVGAPRGRRPAGEPVGEGAATSWRPGGRRGRNGHGRGFGGALTGAAQRARGLPPGLARGLTPRTPRTPGRASPKRRRRRASRDGTLASSLCVTRDLGSPVRPWGLGRGGARHVILFSPVRTGRANDRDVRVANWRHDRALGRSQQGAPLSHTCQRRS